MKNNHFSLIVKGSKLTLFEGSKLIHTLFIQNMQNPKNFSIREPKQRISSSTTKIQYKTHIIRFLELSRTLILFRCGNAGGPRYMPQKIGKL